MYRWSLVRVTRVIDTAVLERQYCAINTLHTPITSFSLEFSGIYCLKVKYMLTDISEVCTASIIRVMMEAVCTSEMSVNIYLTTQQYIPEDSKLHIRHHENLKSHIPNSAFWPQLKN
jgi:hypothetical protein